MPVFHQRGLWRYLLPGIALLAILIQVSCAAPFIPGNPSSQQQSSGFVPHLIPASCPMTLPSTYTQGKNIECSYLVVKENRAVADSRELLLAVARIKSSDPHPASDPLIMLQGGPGGALLHDFDGFVSVRGFSPDIARHDIIVIDQRGTGYSSPPMKCDEEFSVMFAQVEQHLPMAEALRQQDQGTRDCRTRLQNQLHIDLNDYTTLTDANDIHDLITALKVPQVDIYGVSYGTRLALEVMRSFPQGVRSVILDSTVPAQLNVIQDNPNAVARVYRTLFDDCAAEPSCAKAHPQLEQRFWSFVAKAQKTPVIMTLQDTYTQRTYQKANITGLEFALGFWQMFYVTEIIPAIPRIMEEVMQGNNSTFARIYGLLTFDQSVNYGMYHSVECNEDQSRTSQAQIEANARHLDASIQSDMALNTEDAVLSECQIWNVKSEAAPLEQAVSSSIPTLVMKGTYDPVTPPAYGEEAAKTLSRSYQVLVPSTGHGVMLSGQACPAQIGGAFLQDPIQPPDTACLQQMPAKPLFK